jgi:hypothetical protein
LTDRLEFFDFFHQCVSFSLQLDQLPRRRVFNVASTVGGRIAVALANDLPIPVSSTTTGTAVLLFCRR